MDSPYLRPDNFFVQECDILLWDPPGFVTVVTGVESKIIKNSMRVWSRYHVQFWWKNSECQTTPARSGHGISEAQPVYSHVRVSS